MASLFLEPNEMQLVWNCLMEQSGKAVYPVARKMHHQMIEQGLVPDDLIRIPEPEMKKAPTELETKD